MMHKRVLALVFVIFLLAACCDDESSGEVVLRVDEDGNAFSPTELQGSVEYLPSMKPKAMRVIRLDDKLNPIDSFDVAVKNLSDKDFFVDSRDYEYPYVKIVTVFPAEDKKTMEFAQYVRLSGDNTKLKQNIYAALAADRIEYLVKKKKKSFDDAEKQALEELDQIFDNNLESVNNEYYNEFYYTNRLMDRAPFVFCRHEISDSVFYEDFKKFRSTFAEKGKIDSLWIVKAADAWLSTFEILRNPVDYLFKSVSRDTVNGLIWLNVDFFERAYGIELDADGSYDSVQIDNKASAFYGRTLLWTEYVKNNGMTRWWRLKSVLEDSLGSCLAGMVNFRSSESVQRNDTLYVCRSNSHMWVAVTDRDSLFNYQYGECSVNHNMGKLLYVNDSLFVCECEGKSCSWSDKYATKIFSRDDSWYEAVLSAKAIAEYGECDYLNSGLLLPLDSVFVQCSEYKWKEVDSLNYYLGDCTYTNNKGEHLGVYYGCRNDDSPWAHDWEEILAPAYYDSICFTDNDNEILKFGDDYFICELDPSGFTNNYASANCSVKGCWRKMDDVELIPPVKNLDWCTSSVNRKVVYDDVFYECDDGKWRVADNDMLSVPEQDGLVCDSSLFGAVRRYGSNYYTCETNFKWRVLKASEFLPVLYRDSLGSCDTILKKVLHWNENEKTFVGCTAMDGVYEWRTITVGTSPYTLPASIDRKKIAGEYITGSVYKVTVDGVDYLFDIYKWSSTINVYNLILRHMDVDGTGYDAYAYNGHLFLHGERGKDSLLISSIQEKSSSFDDFYADWKKRVSDDCRCNGSGVEVQDSSVSVIMYDENTYMDYEKAKTFCPKGYHIPDSTEFMNAFKFKTTEKGFRNDSPIRWNFALDPPRNLCSVYYRVYADLFWTSSEKDSGTQYCYETAMDSEQRAHRIVECPKDLYPMVQVMCMMDE